MKYVNSNIIGDAVVDELINTSAQMAQGMGRLALWLQALGLLVILWIAFQLINLWLNNRKWRKLIEFEGKINNLERKIDRLLKK